MYKSIFLSISLFVFAFSNEFEVRPTVLASESVHFICKIWVGAVG